MKSNVSFYFCTLLIVGVGIFTVLHRGADLPFPVHSGLEANAQSVVAKSAASSGSSTFSAVVDGLRVNANEPLSRLLCLGIIAVATLGKLGGSSIAARWTGMSWSQSLQLGALMNTRGLMELIVLNMGYDLGILSPRIFTMMVIMALVTTMMTGPLLTLFGSRQPALGPEAVPA